MRTVHRANGKFTASRALIVAATVLAGASTAGISAASSGGAHRAARSIAAAPPKTITAVRITRRRGTLRPGTSVRARDLGQRVFPNASHGFALAHVGQADYPAATVNGGRSWHTNGPALHLDAAQAPLSVADAGAANQRTFFAFGGGQVVDATGDGGKHWWSAILGEDVLAVVPRIGGGILAVVQDAPTGAAAATLVYVSTDGGHHWHRRTTLGGF
jgi:hypothetical protein